MSFGGLGAGDTLYAAAAGRGGDATTMQAGVITLPTTKANIISSLGLSLGLQANPREMEKNKMVMAGSSSNGAGFEYEIVPRNNKDEEIDSRSGSDNVDGGSGDDIELENPRKRKKKYHRHTPHQIEQLEALFKECPHPDEKQRMELSRLLNLECRQVKFWFQNRRTQMKTQIERHENAMLRQDNDKLRAENVTFREAMKNPICNNCGGPAILGDVSAEEQHLRIEYARLRDELDRVCSITAKFLGRQISTMANPMSHSLDLAVGNSHGGVFAGMSNVAPTMPAVPNLQPVPMGAVPYGTGMSPPQKPTVPIYDKTVERPMIVERALMAMEELVKMAQMGEPLWVRSMDGSGKEMLNYEEYIRVFPSCLPLKPVGFVSEASKETAIVMINSLSLVETMMHPVHFRETFSSMVAWAITTDIISNGDGGSRDNVVHTMYAEMQVLSPLVPIHEVNFVRFCKQHGEGVWAVVDVSTDGIRDCARMLGTSMATRRMPSGFLVQDMPNGYSKITWIEHVEYEEAAVSPMYRPLMRSGMGLGAQRWVATLQRRFECLAILMSSSLPGTDPTGILSAAGQKSMLRLSQRMTDNFFAGVCGSSVHKWSVLRLDSIGEGIRVMTRHSVNDPGEPSGVILSAATSVWLPVAARRLFDFIRDEHLRSQWDILSNGEPMHEVARIAKGQDLGNAVSLLRANARGDSQNGMLILQETCTDDTGSIMVYAPVDTPAMNLVMSGGESAYVAILPSGFAIVPDGPPACVQSSNVNDGGVDPPMMMGGGSLLTVAFQILVNSVPGAKLTVESVTTVNSLIIKTVSRIKVALQCED